MAEILRADERWSCPMFGLDIVSSVPIYFLHAGNTGPKFKKLQNANGHHCSLTSNMHPDVIYDAMEVHYPSYVETGGCSAKWVAQESWKVRWGGFLTF